MTTFEEAQGVIDRWRDDHATRSPRSLNSELSRDDWSIISDYVNSRFSEDEQIILFLYDSFRREFTVGHRCGVCGRTKAQNEAIGYDCIREC
jgi:hypothetical protein